MPIMAVCSATWFCLVTWLLLCRNVTTQFIFREDPLGNSMVKFPFVLFFCCDRKHRTDVFLCVRILTQLCYIGQQAPLRGWHRVLDGWPKISTFLPTFGRFFVLFCCLTMCPCESFWLCCWISGPNEWTVETHRPLSPSKGRTVDSY